MSTYKEADVSVLSRTETVPPPYSTSAMTNEHAPEIGEGSSIAAPPSGQAGEYLYRRFPQQLNAYFSMKWTTATIMQLGEHQDHPLFCIEIHSGISSKPEITLHNGPTKDDPAIAYAHRESLMSTKMKVTLPPQLGQTREEIIHVDTKNKWKYMTYMFNFNVGNGKETHLEYFEWRHSRGEEIQALDKRAGWGWKLVRMDSDVEGGGGKRKERPEGSTSDGKEVVATWIMNGSFSMKKAFKFELIGSGANGTLGERFEMMALLSALKIYLWEWATEISAVSAAAAT